MIGWKIGALLCAVQLFSYFAADFMHFKNNLKAEFKWGCIFVATALVFFLYSIFIFFTEPNDLIGIGMTFNAIMLMFGSLCLAGLRQIIIGNSNVNSDSSFYVWVYQGLRKGHEEK